MAFRMGLLGQKVGMTQTFTEKGNWVPLTVIQVGPCVVLDVLTPERNGYSAIRIGLGERRERRTRRPEMGLYRKVGCAPARFVREVRLSPEEAAQFQPGQVLRVDQVFSDGDTVDVTGTSKGKGFQGVMKRHGFAGFKATHGTHETFRHGGSIGCRLTPGRVVKGKKMAGQMGNRRVTVQNITVHEVIPEKNLLLIKGAAPGSPDGLVLVRLASKRPYDGFELGASQAAGDEAAPATAEA